MSRRGSGRPGVRPPAAGLTMVEVLVSLALLGMAMASIIPAFMSQLRSNDRNDLRSAAVLASQQVMEELRLENVETLPTSGETAPLRVTVGERPFDVVTSYCRRPALCSSRSRHLRVEVFFEGRRVYDAETVYTTLF